ncbi:MAG TPA: SLC13 family permease, partial [Reyranellaceae bacterium]|nr:SLC13 family permease [Reyranellaceae bacterium]
MLTTEQTTLFVLFAVVLGLLLWDRLRHDLVAAAGLLAAVVLGVVPADKAFSGFSDPAVVIVALVLIASRAFENSGAMNAVSRNIAGEKRSVSMHILLICGLGAAISSVMNNVAALALLMPLDIRAARLAGRPPGLTLMPLACATVLGGIITLIGTPANIVASGIRQERLGAPYGMFDFTVAGVAISAAGVVFLAFVGWRLLPRRADPGVTAAAVLSFKAELRVPEGSPAVGRVVSELDEDAERADLLILGLTRGARPYYARARRMVLQPRDRLLVEGSTEAIAEFIKAVGLQDAAKPAEPADAEQPRLEGDGEPARPAEAPEAAPQPAIVEAVVRPDSRLVGRTAVDLELRSRFAVTVLAVSRAGVFVPGGLRNRPIEAGDLLLLAGVGAARRPTLEQLGVIAVGTASIGAVDRRRIALAVGLFVGAIAISVAGLLPFTISLAIAVAGYAITKLVPARQFYEQVDWPVIVMLACLLPLGAAFDKLGGTALMADAIVFLTRGQSAVFTLVVLMMMTMLLSDLLNNVANMVIAGPLAIELAQRLQVNPDTFLMGAVIATSCSFLTPIGHHNNTLVMGPGGYRFGDYWRMGLPMELLCLVVGVPVLLA